MAVASTLRMAAGYPCGTDRGAGGNAAPSPLSEVASEHERAAPDGRGGALPEGLRAAGRRAGGWRIRARGAADRGTDGRTGPRTRRRLADRRHTPGFPRHDDSGTRRREGRPTRPDP